MFLMFHDAESQVWIQLWGAWGHHRLHPTTKVMMTMTYHLLSPWKVLGTVSRGFNLFLTHLPHKCWENWDSHRLSALPEFTKLENARVWTPSPGCPAPSPVPFAVRHSLFFWLFGSGFPAAGTNPAIQGTCSLCGRRAVMWSYGQWTESSEGGALHRRKRVLGDGVPGTLPPPWLRCDSAAHWSFLDIKT